jgi:hypothetical protein
VVELGSAAAALLVYGATLAPSLTWAHWGADGGDFVTAAVTGRIPHPPGFPLYLLLARGFARLPWGDPAWRLTLLSAVLAAAAVALVAATLRRRGASPWIALTSALTLAFAPLFWSQALITEVYTTAAFFVALTLFCALAKQESEDRESRIIRRSRGFAVGLTWGLGISVHPTLLLLAPLWSAWLRSAQYGIRDLGAPVLGCGIGLLPYALLPLFGPWPQPWGDLRSPGGWWDVVSARLYWGYAFGLPPADWPQRALAWAALMARQFTPVGALAVLLGLTALWRQARSLGVGVVAALGLGSLYAIGYDTPDSLVYLAPLLPVAAWLLGEGLRRIARWGAPQWLGPALPVVLLVWNWRALDVHHDREALDWLRRTLDAAPPYAVLVTAQDPHTFTLWYAQDVLGERPDVLVVDRDLWVQPAYRQFVSARAGQDAVRPQDFAVGRPLCAVEVEEVRCP